MEENPYQPPVSRDDDDGSVRRSFWSQLWPTPRTEWIVVIVVPVGLAIMLLVQFVTLTLGL
jgi:hypothetical protein